MCGIAGLWGSREASTVEGMMQQLAHRGPDGSGLHRDEEMVLGHRRLAIMDPIGGSQPLHNEQGSVTMVANGEIYNFAELRRGLQARHRFSTDSDSEVILHLFEEDGPQALSHLDGMFAVAIGDGAQLLLARDPIGIKPLYYGTRTGGQGQELLFASEMKALAGCTEQMHELPPGACYRFGSGVDRYYQVPCIEPEERPLEEWTRRVRATLEEAVVKRLMSDVPLGAFLSGGLDSSLIAALVRRHQDELHTFSVGVEGSGDLQAARQVAEHLGTLHHEFVFTVQDVLDHLPEIIYHLESFDQDLVRSAIPTFFCSRLAAEHVKVILTGEGADELFAGYTYYKSIGRPEELHRELRRSVTALHNINLQRVDRMTMAHGLEGRVPFLDLKMIELGLRIPPRWKLRRDPTGRLVEKWILRKACEDLLPAEILWRDKAQFDEGSGATDLLQDLIQSLTRDLDSAGYVAEHGEARLRSPEECFYHRLFVQGFERPGALIPNIGRWSLPASATV